MDDRGVLVRYDGVELCKVGQYKASLGDGKVTLADLESAVAASSDPDLPKPHMGPGHFDPISSALSDGEPALGWVEGLRVKGDTLVGNLVGIPKAFADRMPSMYRNRSVELKRNVKSASGKTYPAVLSRLALLGAAPPAITSLADVMTLSSEVASAPDVAIDFNDDDGPDPREALVRLALSAGSDADPADLLRALDAVGGAQGGAIPAAPGGIGNDGGRTEGGPVAQITDEKIRELMGIGKDADVEAELKKLKASADGGNGGNGDGSGSGDGGNTGKPGEGGNGDGGNGSGTGTENKPGEGGSGDGGNGEGAGSGSGTPDAGAKLPNGMVAISDEVLQKLIADAGAGASAATTIADRDREAELVSLSQKGIIAPADMGYYRELLKVAPDQTRELLKNKAPAFSTFSAGSDSSGTGDGRSAADAAFDSFESQMFGLDNASAQA